MGEAGAGVSNPQDGRAPENSSDPLLPACGPCVLGHLEEMNPHGHLPQPFCFWGHIHPASNDLA